MQKTINSMVATVSMVLMIVGSVALVAATEYDLVVEGTANPLNDVPAVQAAIDQGGKVLLEGTFDFGDEGSVSILNDVEIHGSAATIKNGKQAFAVGFDPSLPDGGPRVQSEVVFKNLKFESASWSSIYVLATSGLTVKNCTFEDGKSYPWFEPWGLGGHFSIFLQGGWALWNPYTGEPSDITGDINIKNNEWKGNARKDEVNGFAPWVNPFAVPMNGILDSVLMVNGKDVSVTIENNKSENNGWYNFVVNNIHGENSMIEVVNNTMKADSDNLAQAAVALFSHMHAWTADMYPGWSEIEPGDPDVTLVARGNIVDFKGEVRNYTEALNIGSIRSAIIENNRIDLETDVVGLDAGGIGLGGVQDSIVKNNRIAMNSTVSGEYPEAWTYGIVVWASYDGSNRNEISNNKINGAANFGIEVGDASDEWPSSNDNVFKNNDLKHLDLVEFEVEYNGRTYTEAHVLFDIQSAGNVYFGNRGEKVLDFGTDNEYQVGHGHAYAP